MNNRYLEESKKLLSKKENPTQFCNRIAKFFGATERQGSAMEFVLTLPPYLILKADSVLTCKERYSMDITEEFMKRPIVKEVEEMLDGNPSMVEFLAYQFHFIFDYKVSGFNSFDYYLRLPLDEALEIERVLMLAQDIEAHDVWHNLREQRENL